MKAEPSSYPAIKVSPTTGLFGLSANARLHSASNSGLRAWTSETAARAESFDSVPISHYAKHCHNTS